MIGIKKVENGRSSPLECEYCGWPNNADISTNPIDKNNPSIVSIAPKGGWGTEFNVVIPNPEHWAIQHQREYHFDKILERLEKLEEALQNKLVRWFHMADALDRTSESIDREVASGGLLSHADVFEDAVKEKI